jgi:type I restriction enzyme S subunit
MANVLDLRIPLPPFQIQEVIVSILDKFTELDTELEAELEARRKQYAQYRRRLLSTHLPANVEFKTLKELLGPIARGKRLTKANLAEVGSIPVFHGGLEPIGYHDKSNTPGETVMVINTGASSGSVGWSTTPFWCSDGCFALPHSNEFSSRYVYYYASLNEQFFMDKVRKAGIPTLAAESIYSLPIPVLPMAKQLEIVGILDAFLGLASDDSMGLPAEITARRQQYEYYRNKLLTFKELKAS